jgi:hypothetical protein
MALNRRLACAVGLALVGSTCGAHAQLQSPGVNPVVSDNYGNTAMGTQALNVIDGNAYFGDNNTAAGYQALYSSQNSIANTAFGAGALYSDTVGLQNTAVGSTALYTNLTGDNNVAIGTLSMYYNTSGGYNTALGTFSLNQNTSGSYNTATGMFALHDSTSAGYNVADGVFALRNNTEGGENTAIGSNALNANTTGSYNIAVGYGAGKNVVSGSSNINIGSPGGSAEENKTIRIGTNGVHKATYVQGIYGVPLTGSQVVVASDGQLGVVVSSERYKTDVATMGDASSRLDELRPVTFRLKTDGNGTTQYGLIAEEVARIYPELVVRGEDGRIDGVRYEELAPMLLNEVQRQARKLSDQDERIGAQERQLQDLRRQLDELRTKAQAGN